MFPSAAAALAAALQLAAAPAATCSSGSCPRGAGPSHSTSPAATAAFGRRLIALSSSNCAACHRAEPALSAAERACAVSGVKVQRETVDIGRGSAIAQRYGIRDLPAYVFVDERGEELARLEGPQPEDRLERAMAKLAGAPCTPSHSVTFD
jgi:cytochrome c-type biogenesis protein